MKCKRCGSEGNCCGIPLQAEVERLTGVAERTAESCAELGAKLEQAEQQRDYLVELIVRAAKWPKGCESYAHAIGHIENVISNLRVDAKTEKKLREQAEAEWDCKSGSEACSIHQEKGYPCYRHLDHAFRKSEADNAKLIKLFYSNLRCSRHDAEGCECEGIAEERLEQALKERDDD